MLFKLQRLACPTTGKCYILNDFRSFASQSMDVTCLTTLITEEAMLGKPTALQARR